MASQVEEKVGKARVTHINVMAEANEDVCWICLDGPTLDRPLQHACRCPSWTHASCIARWQLQSAGTRREQYCDFCNSELPDWKAVLTPLPGATAPAVMNVNFDNKTYSFQVAPGADGYRQFTEAIRKAFHLPDDSELNITFTCDEPSSAGSLLTLSGPGAYDAAVHCAAVSAARRSMSSDEGTLGAGGQPHHAVLDSMPSRNGRREGHGDAATSSGHCPQDIPQEALGNATFPPDADSNSSSRHRARSRSNNSRRGNPQQQGALPSGAEIPQDLLEVPEGVIGHSSSGTLTPPDCASPGGYLSDVVPESDPAAGTASSSSSRASTISRAASTSSGYSSSGSSTTAPRRGGNLGRKLRDALTELLISK